LEAEDFCQPTAKPKRSSRWLSPRGREMTSLGSRPGAGKIRLAGLLALAETLRAQQPGFAPAFSQQLAAIIQLKNTDEATKL